MPSFVRNSTINADGNSGTTRETVTGGESAKVTLTLPAGKSATLTTRTDDNTGVITSAAHGLTTSDRVSVFWTTSGVEYFRANMEITATTTDTISVDGGFGDVLPAAASSLVVGQVVGRVVAWDGTYNGMVGFAATCGARRGSITAQEVGTLAGVAATDCIKHLKTDSPGYMWLNSDGDFDFTTDILYVSAALGDANGAGGVASISRLDS